MLAKLIEEGFGAVEDYNCAEKILYGSNIVYKLGLSDDALKMAAGFGGGMGIESTCGVITAGVMVLSQLFTETVAHQSDVLKPLTNEFISKYNALMGSIDCASLKDIHRTEAIGCSKVIVEGAKILDEIVVRELNI